jgi:cell wall-associated NlpC family hydrolase
MRGHLRFYLALVAVAGALVMVNARAQDSSLGESSLTGTSDSKTNTALISTSPIPLKSDRIATLVPSDLREYDAQPPVVQKLIADSLALTTQNLSYKYGSDDPKNGGMDCSGTVYYILNEAGLKDVPRDSSEMYKWTWQRGHVQPVTSSSPDSFELSRLKPGDLLFWSGTYAVDRDPPITHVMIYLGINRHTGRRVMVGASEGRRFNDKSRYGVSVFDFTLPGRKRAPDAGSGDSSSAQFIGYGPIPGFDKTLPVEPVKKSSPPSSN